MDGVDQLTLELFLNRNTYGKYLSKKDPSKNFANEDYRRKLEKHTLVILERTRQLVSGNGPECSNSLQEAFDIYAKEVIREMELRDNSKIYEDDNEDDPDNNETLFPQLLEEDVKDETEKEEDNEEPTPKQGKSYWGKEKVVKASSSISAADSFFLRRRKPGV